MSSDHCLVLRLAGPLQSWGGRSQFARRETLAEPTKGGIVGLLAAAQGRRRSDPIEDLIQLALGVRSDQPGTLLRDFHTVSDYRGVGLPTATVDARGRQKRRSSAASQLTERFYLQDAVFVAAIHAPVEVLTGLVDAVRNPTFPLALGRRACPPSHPLILAHRPGEQDLWPGRALHVLGDVPWQAGEFAQRRVAARRHRPPTIDLPVTVDDSEGEDVRVDVPVTFSPRERTFTSRRFRQAWVHLPPPYEVEQGDNVAHDPFALLGW